MRARQELRQRGEAASDTLRQNHDMWFVPLGAFK